ncbi:DUF2490 domain-containing protein [Marinigracilibium pacificum]|uniref:DUF2490 domain-containing protein n=1 Tax=Marinigracilibium pacificum TaxID=2729599 RepID=A0A848IX42_9BACT|nr:DUF2490 domain-containing protein [Marinigracilibium pacificum]NMM47861.1 DUF2490 domain-containing protein [Marinigracilibium pacificum]
MTLRGYTLITGLFIYICSCMIPVFGQTTSDPEESVLEEPITILWVNTYGNIRLSKRLFWDAQTHFRFQEKGDKPFAGQIAQLYNRHAIGYIFSKKFNVRAGGVLRINFNTKGTTEENSWVPEWRIWHQYQFAMPLSRLMVYHRIRIEHRWSKGYAEDAEYIYRNRWRYMLRLKLPLNNEKLAPKTFYLAPETELIMQSGAPVVDSPMEDLRITTTLGYIINPRLTFAAGAMYSLGQELSDGAYYKQKWAMRFHMYYAPDFRKVKHKLPSIHLND